MKQKHAAKASRWGQSREAEELSKALIPLPLLGKQLRNSGNTKEKDPAKPPRFQLDLVTEQVWPAVSQPTEHQQHSNEMNSWDYGEPILTVTVCQGQKQIHHKKKKYHPDRPSNYSSTSYNFQHSRKLSKGLKTKTKREITKQNSQEIQILELSSTIFKKLWWTYTSNKEWHRLDLPSHIKQLKNKQIYEKQSFRHYTPGSMGQ